MLIAKNIALKEMPKVVLYWYICGMCPHIIQNEDGIELDEILHSNGCILNKKEKLKYDKILPINILEIVFVYFSMLESFTDYIANIRVDDGNNTKILKFIKKQIKENKTV